MLYSLKPINKTAAIISSQASCQDSILITGKREINREILRLVKKLARIKKALGVRNKKHWKMLKYRRNIKRDPKVKDKELFFYALYLGERIWGLHKRLEGMKRK